MKISIITTTYNSASTVRDTIESVLRQDYPDIEYIVIDGGSTDGTLDILAQYDGWISKVVSESDSGIYDAMNKGISISTGHVIGMLNSDDFFTSSCIISTVAAAFSADETLDAVYGDIHFADSSDLTHYTRYYSSAHFRPGWLRYGIMPAHPSFYLRRSTYERAGLYDTTFTIASDFEMMVRLYHRIGIKSRYINADFVTMRRGGISTRNLRNRLTITREAVRACRKNGLYTNLLLVSVKYLYKMFEYRRLHKLVNVDKTKNNAED